MLSNLGIAIFRVRFYHNQSVIYMVYLKNSNIAHNRPLIFTGNQDTNCRIDNYKTLVLYKTHLPYYTNNFGGDIAVTGLYLCYIPKMMLSTILIL